MPTSANNVKVETAHRHVVLIGMMGAGKTTVGRLLAARLGWAFWDNDEALCKATGKIAAQIHQERGWAALHETEDQLLRAALRDPTPTVYAAAGSVVLHPKSLNGVTTVWLRISAARDELNVARSGEDHRPLPPEAGAILKRLGDERGSAYARLADAVVDVGSTPEATCKRVIDALNAIRSHPVGRDFPPIG